MTAETKTIPLEIWNLIINQVDCVKDLARCRLVCRAWDLFAEAAMLGQNLELTNKDTITKMCRHLTKKPHLARHIKYMRLNRIDEIYLPLQQELLRLALTPNIRELQGYMEEQLYAYLMDIAQNSQQKFDKLQSLPYPLKINKTYVETLLFFKESLCELKVATAKLVFKPVLDRLDEFKSLIRLDLEYETALNNLMDLENILKKCNHLQALELQLYSEGNYSMGKEELEKWLLKNVTKVPCLQSFNLSRVMRPDLIEYLVYKYHNVSELVFGPFTATVKGSAGRIVDAVKDVDSVGLFMWAIHSMEDFEELILKMKSKKNRVRIGHSFPKNEDGTVRLDVIRSKQDGTTNFNIQLEKNVLPEIHGHLISLIGPVRKLTIEYLSYRNKQDNANLSFYSLLKMIPEIEILEFTDSSIGHSALLLDSLVLDRLTSLKICGAIIVDQKTFPELGRIAPNLRHLTLNNCILDLMCQNHSVCLPQADLKSLSINEFCFQNNEDAEITEYLRKIQSSISITKNTLVFLQITTMSSHQYYFLQAGTPSSSMKISQELSMNHLVGWPNITITCRSLGRLKINLGELVIDMKVDTQQAH